MQFYNGTGCLVFLVGQIAAMPMALKKHTDTSIIVTRQRQCINNRQNPVQNYRVILSQKDAMKIIQFGFPGMTISVRGDLSSNINAEIIAEKIEFIDFPNSNQSTPIPKITSKINELSGSLNIEMSYWFSNDGSMRKELMYIH
jgi:hypothetical protein